MKKILKSVIILIISFALGKGVQADVIDNITMNIYINEDGSANISEVWNVKAESGSEWYKEFRNLGNSELSNYSVLMDGNPLIYKDWNINETINDKSGYYGINYVYNGFDLCFGKGDMNNHIFTINYTLSNYVFNTDDNQVLYWTLFPKATLNTFRVQISSYYEFPDTLDVWGYGYKGYAFVSDGKITLSSAGALSNNNVVVLAKFPLNTFNTFNTNSEFQTFDDVLTRAKMNSYNYDYYSHHSNDSAKYELIAAGVSITSTALIAGLIIFLLNIKTNDYGYAGNKKINMSNTQIFRDIPCNKDIYYANALLYLNNFKLSKYKNTNIFGAILLKWIKEDKIKLIVENKGTFNIETCSIDLSKNVSFDDEAEDKLFKVMKKAAGYNKILEKKELEKWCNKHYEEFYKVFDKITKEKIDNLKANRLIRKRVNKRECKKKYVLNEKIYNDSKELYGLKRYLLEFSNMDKKTAIEVKLWDEYLMFAYLFGIADKVIKQFKDLYPEIVLEMEQVNIDMNTVILIDTLSKIGISSADKAKIKSDRQSAESYSSGGGGFSSGGGGGGSFGGGGSMGGR